jgi:hypothetical protein
MPAPEEGSVPREMSDNASAIQAIPFANLKILHVVAAAHRTAQANPSQPTLLQPAARERRRFDASTLRCCIACSHHAAMCAPPWYQQELPVSPPPHASSPLHHPGGRDASRSPCPAAPTARSRSSMCIAISFGSSHLSTPSRSLFCRGCFCSVCVWWGRTSEHVYPRMTHVFQSLVSQPSTLSIACFVAVPTCTVCQAALPFASKPRFCVFVPFLAYSSRKKTSTTDTC